MNTIYGCIYFQCMAFDGLEKGHFCVCIYVCMKCLCVCIWSKPFSRISTGPFMLFPPVPATAIVVLQCNHSSKTSSLLFPTKCLSCFGYQNWSSRRIYTYLFSNVKCQPFQMHSRALNVYSHHSRHILTQMLGRDMRLYILE